jgi:putative hemolysin
MITALFTLVALLLVAWLTAAATAVRSVSRIWLRHWVERQLAGAGTIEAYLARPHRLVLSAGAGVAVLVTLAGTTLGAQPHAAGWSLALEGIALAIALLVLGQLVPRAIARRFAPALIPVLLPPLHAAAWILAPLMRATRAVGRAIRPRHRARPASPREGLADLLREGELEGIGEPDEIDIISGVVQFGE